MKIKPVVQYATDEFSYIAVGHRASVQALDHPELGNEYVSTSEVLSYDRDTGAFETLNTLYVPYKA